MKKKTSTQNTEETNLEEATTAQEASAVTEEAAAEEKPSPVESKASKGSAPWGKLGPKARGAMVDPDTNVKYTVNPVPMAGEPKEGSWFDCQMKAGLLQIIRGPAE